MARPFRWRVLGSAAIWSMASETDAWSATSMNSTCVAAISSTWKKSRERGGFFSISRSRSAWISPWRRSAVEAMARASRRSRSVERGEGAVGVEQRIERLAAVEHAGKQGGGGSAGGEAGGRRLAWGLIHRASRLRHEPPGDKSYPHGPRGRPVVPTLGTATDGRAAEVAADRAVEGPAGRSRIPWPSPSARRCGSRSPGGSRTDCPCAPRRAG